MSKIFNHESEGFVLYLEDSHINNFTEVGGRNITMNGQVMAGEWIDVIRFRNWLQNDMQYRIYNLLIMNTKIPYTNGGIALVENQMLASLKSGQSAGGVAPDEYDADGVLTPGFTVTVPNSRDFGIGKRNAARNQGRRGLRLIFNDTTVNFSL